MDLIILDMSAEYLRRKCPEEYVSAGFRDVGALVDGKDDNCDTVRKDSAWSRLQ
jgi:hypothetical protein